MKITILIGGLLGFLAGPSYASIALEALRSAAPADPGPRSSAVPTHPRSVRDSGLNLHNHTYCSDGSDTPELLVESAKKAGIRELAITDHDNVACIARAQEAAQKAGIRLIPGIEISAEDDSLHILGINIDVNDPGLQRLMARSRKARFDRTKEIVAKLNTLTAAGRPIRISLNDVLIGKLNAQQVSEGKPAFGAAETQGMPEDQLLAKIIGPLNRPDVARTLIAKGYVADSRAAFDQYLGDEAGAAAELEGVPFREVIQAIHAAGGIASIAHPHTIYKFKKTPLIYSGKLYANFSSLLEDLLAAGLDGVEQFKNDHGPEPFIVDLVNRYTRQSGRNILFTPGSDYHGSSGVGQPHIEAIDIPQRTADNIRAALR